MTGLPDTRTKFRRARKALGMSQSQLAKALRKKSGARLIRAYEAGDRDIPEDTALLFAYFVKFGPLDSV